MNIIWKKPDGTLAVTSIFDDSDPSGHAALLQERGDIPADWIVGATAIDEFPMSWPYQLDWRLVDGAVVVDLPSAKETTRSRLRAQRVPLLADLDIQFQRALESGASTESIVAEKQRLRDVPELVDDCTNLGELSDLTC